MQHNRPPGSDFVVHISHSLLSSRKLNVLKWNHVNRKQTTHPTFTDYDYYCIIHPPPEINLFESNCQNGNWYFWIEMFKTKKKRINLQFISSIIGVYDPRITSHRKNFYPISRKAKSRIHNGQKTARTLHLMGRNALYYSVYLLTYWFIL